MKLFKQITLLSIPIFFFIMIVSIVSAAAPDGVGPWADNVVSSSQGLMKNGGSVPIIRSNPSSALGVAENDTVEGNFFSLGFGGNIVLGFDNGISNGAMIVEATNPGYPGETATVEMSEDGVTWVVAGNLTADGTVNQPDGVSCAQYVRITDTSNTANFSDETADGFDVDGVQAVGDACTPTTPSPTPTNTPANPTPTNGPSSCTSPGVTTVPVIVSSNRISPTSIFVSWGPNAGLNNFIVEYGFQNGVWLFSTSVTGFSTTINSLPANQPIYIHVAATDGCATGAYGTPVLVGGTLTAGPGFPNTGNPLIPGLPNTGFGPGKNIPLTVFSLLGISILVSTSLVTVLRKRKILV